MKFKIVESIDGWKAKIKIKGNPQPIDVFYSVDTYMSFDAAVKATYKDSFEQYTIPPSAVWKKNNKKT